MGMYDSVMVKCPSCPKYVEFQAKAGECMMNKYGLEEAPVEILVAIEGRVESCKCGVKMKIHTQFTKVSQVIEV